MAVTRKAEKNSEGQPDKLTIYPEGWSPDGTRILYDLDNWIEDECGLDSGHLGVALYTIGVRGARRTLLAHSSTYVGQAEWSPDGTRIVYSLGFQGPPCAYYLTSDSGRRQRQILSFGDLCERRAALPPRFAWDATGQALIFGGQDGLRRLPIGSRRAALLSRDRVDDCCRVSPDDQIIAFIVGNRIRELSASGHEVTTVVLPALLPKGLAIVDLAIPSLHLSVQ
jgi:hypothetical protein